MKNLTWKEWVALVIAVLLLSWAHDSHASPFDLNLSEAEWHKEYAYDALLAVDWLQTRYIARHPDRFDVRCVGSACTWKNGYDESWNGMLGHHPTVGKVNMNCLLWMLAHPYITQLLPEKYRPMWQWGSITVEATAVAHNFHIGLKLDF